MQHSLHPDPNILLWPITITTLTILLPLHNHIPPHLPHLPTAIPRHNNPQNSILQSRRNPARIPHPRLLRPGPQPHNPLKHTDLLLPLPHRKPAMQRLVHPGPIHHAGNPQRGTGHIVLDAEVVFLRAGEGHVHEDLRRGRDYVDGGGEVGCRLVSSVGLGGTVLVLEMRQDLVQAEVACEGLDEGGQIGPVWVGLVGGLGVGWVLVLMTSSAAWA